MFMLLLNGNRYNPETFINVRQVYGTTLNNSGQSVPVKSAFGSVVSGGNTLSIPVKTINGTTINAGNVLSVPVKSVYGYLLVTEA
ncbi:TPA: hypothetical protein ACGAD2_005498 [Salmonella enterica subsp. enterica serovar Newport]